MGPIGRLEDCSPGRLAGWAGWQANKDLLVRMLTYLRHLLWALSEDSKMPVLAGKDLDVNVPEALALGSIGGLKDCSPGSLAGIGGPRVFALVESLAVGPIWKTVRLQPWQSCRDWQA